LMFKYFLYEVDVGKEAYKKRGSNLAYYDLFVLDESLVNEGLEELVRKVQETTELKYVILRDSGKSPIISSKIESVYLVKPVMQESIYELLETPEEEQVEYGDGIRYSDFLALVENRGDFRKTFEDIMFSTKVVITDKDEFIDFVTRLSDEGFDEMALGYLDATAHLFGNDQEVLALYHVVQGMKK